MLQNYIHKLNKSPRAKKDFSFTVHNVFLQVMRNRLGNAKILHGFGHCNPNLLANAEKVVNSSPAGENNSRML